MTNQTSRRVLPERQRAGKPSGTDQPGGIRRIENPLSEDSAKYLRRWADNLRDEFRRAMYRRRVFQFYQPQEEEQGNG